MRCIDCGSNDTKRNGRYQNNQERIQRWLCKACSSSFSFLSPTLDPHTKQEHRPELNDPVLELHLQGLSQREIAKRLGCARKTVVRKLKKYL
jgi:transposase-like protein